MAKYSKKSEGRKKNKYGMIALTFNRSTKLSHIVPNTVVGAITFGYDSEEVRDEIFDTKAEMCAESFMNMMDELLEENAG